MAYTPSINDINEISNYQPTLSDALETHAPAASQSTINQITQSAPIQGVLGAGDAIRNFLGDVGGMLPSPFMDLSKPIGQSNSVPMAPSGAGTAYNVGNIAGNIGTFMGGGEMLDAARAGMEGLPYLGKAAQYLGGNGFAGALRQGLGTAGYGAVTTPQNRTGGAAQGAAISAGLSVLPPIFGAAAKFFTPIKPQDTSNAIIQALGGGKSLEDNAQSLAQDLQGSYQQQVKNTDDILNPVFDRVGSSSVFAGVNPSDSAYQSLNQKVLNSYSPKIDNLHQEFIDNPTFQNAHDLQSQLGSSIGKYQLQDAKGNLDAASRNVMEYQQQARGALHSDMNDFLNTADSSGGLSQQYNQGIDYFRENVAPYLQDSSVSQIAKGKIINPDNITSIFKSPEPYMQKIVGDMGAQANNKILYAQLGKNAASLKPEQLISQFQGLDKAGLGSYVHPSLNDQISNLQDQISAREKQVQNYTNVQRGAGALAGMAISPIAHGYLSPELAGVLGATIGGAVTPMMARGIQKLKPVTSLASSLANNTAKTYPFVSNSIKANTANGGQ